MTQANGVLKRAASVAASGYRRLVRVLELLIPVFDLSVRLYLAHIFWTGGMVKLSSWISTVMLFTMVYDVPLLSPEHAAYRHRHRVGRLVPAGDRLGRTMGGPLALRAQYRGVAHVRTVV